MATGKEAFKELMEETTVAMNTIYDDFKNRMQSQFEQFYNVEDQTKLTTTDYQMAGFGEAVRMPELTDFPSDEMLSGGTVSYTGDYYGLSATLSHQALKYDQKGLLKQAPKSLAKSMFHLIQTSAANIFNYGYVTTNKTGFDGLALFSDSHTRLDGGTVLSNMTSTPASLTVTSLQEARTALRTTLDERGKKDPRFATVLVVPPQLEQTAEEIIKSPQRPDTGNRGINVLNNKLTIKVWDYLTYPSRWFVMADDHDLKWKWLEKVQRDSEEGKRNLSMTYYTYCAFAYGFGDWRGVYGSGAA